MVVEILVFGHEVLTVMGVIDLAESKKGHEKSDPTTKNSMTTPLTDEKFSSYQIKSSILKKFQKIKTR